MNLYDYFQNKFGSTDILFDSHCHLTWFPENRLPQIIEGSINAGVAKVIDIAVNLETARKTLENSKKFPGQVYPTAGIDPEVVIPGSDMFDPALTESDIEKMLAQLDELISSNRDQYIMIGECGLDYYWMHKHNLSQAEIARCERLQKLLFAGQIELAAKYSLPLSIHHRDSLADCLKLLSRKMGEVTGIFHSFTGNRDDAELILKQGYSIGINGIATYKSAGNIRDALKRILSGKAMDNITNIYKAGIFFETDAPFLLPRGVKGEHNYPENIKAIFEFLKHEIFK